MNKSFRFLAFLFFAVIIYNPAARAGNVVAADLTYKHISGQTYAITLTVFSECDASISTPAGYQVDFESISCGIQGPFNVLLKSKKTIPACGTTLTRCDGGTGLGFVKAVYSADLTLPTDGGKPNTCTDWVFRWQDCNRSKDITNIVNPETKCLYLETRLNNKDFAFNNSPDFPNNPIAFLTNGAIATINPGTIEKDGDKLVYSLIAPRDKQTTPLTYKSPYTFSNPLSSTPAFAIDPATGIVSITPTKANERTVFAMLIEEFKDGKLRGSVVRDLQIAVLDGKNTPPVLSGLSNSSRTDTTVTAGKQFCFKINGSDVETAQLLTITSNNAIPGGLFSSNPSTRPVGQFCWTPKDSDEGVKTVTFTITDDACPQLSSEKQIKITVKKSGSTCNIFASFNVDTTCIGKKSKFTDFSFPSGNIVSWKWNFGNGTTSDKKLPDIKEYYTKPGKYKAQLIVTDKNKCVDSLEKLITICEIPSAKFDIVSYDKINDTMKIAKICENQNFELIDLTTSPCLLVRREWYANDLLVGGGRRFIYKAKPGQKKITLKVFTEGNCLAEASKSITIEGGPKLKSFSSYDFKCTKLDTLVTMNVTGGTPFVSSDIEKKYLYYWKKTDDKVKISPDSSRRTVTISYPSDITTSIQLYATDANRCSADTVLEIRNPVTIALGTSAYCNSKDIISFTTSTSSSNPVKTSSFWGIKSVLLDLGDGTTANTLLVKHQYAKDTIYKIAVTVLDSAGCIRKAESTVFNLLPDMKFGISKDTICLFESTVNYFGPQFPSWVANAPILHTWNIGGDSLNWQSAGGIFNPTNPKNRIPVFTGNKPVTLKLMYNGTCEKNFETPLHIRPLTVATIDSVQGKCVPFPVKFFVSQKTGVLQIKTINWQFLWRNTSGQLTQVDQSDVLKPEKVFTNHGNHFARITTIDTKGCTNSQSDYPFRVEKMATPCFDISGFCASEKLAFTKDCTSDEFQNIASIKWDFGDNGSELVFNPFHVYSKAGSYKVTSTMYNELDNKGCSKSTDKILTIFPQPVSSFTYDIACFGLPQQFLGDSTPSATVGDFVKKFMWLFDNKNGIVDTARSRNTIYQFKNFTSGTTQLTASMIAVNKFGCGDTLTKNIQVNPKPTANFSYDYADQIVTPNKPMFFEGKFNSSNPNTSTSDVVTWLYDFGDQTKLTSTTGNEQHTYQAVEKYDVRLEVINNFGCRDTIVKKLDLNAYMEVPNTITPNNDGEGEYFEIISRGIVKVNDYKIYNRWGEVVFDGNNDLTAKWDGTYNTQDQPMGVFVYYISATTIYGEVKVKKGNLTLLR